MDKNFFNKAEDSPVIFNLARTKRLLQRHLSFCPLDKKFKLNTFSFHNSPTTSISKTVKRSSKERTIFQTLIPTAHCSSYSRDHDNIGMLESQSQESLPGFQIKTKSNHVVQKAGEISTLEINKWLNQETGLQRLKQAYAIGNFPGMGMFSQQDTQDINTFVFYTGIFGVIISWINSAITHSSFEGKIPKNLSQSQALMKGLYVDKDIPMKVLRDTYRNGGLFTLQAVMMFHLPHVIASYRNETTIWDFFVPSVITYGAHNLSKCPINLLKNVSKGAVVGVIYGYFMTTFLTTHGLTQEDRHLERIKRSILETRSFGTDKEYQHLEGDLNIRS